MAIIKTIRRILTFIIISFLILILYYSFRTDGVGRLYFPTPRYSIDKIPNLAGKVAIVTGGTTGVGRASAEQLVLKGAKLVIITSRYQSSADKAVEQITKEYGSKDGKTKVIGKELSLGDHKSVERFAQWFRSLNEPIHILMLNAGVGDFIREPTSLGMERTVGCNWFGHFYLQHLLQDIVEKSAPSRIVIVASRGATLAPKLTNPIETYVKGDDLYGMQQYMISKLFNVYHASELHRRMRERGINNVYVNSLHPGLVKSGFFDPVNGNLGFVRSLYNLYKEVKEKKYKGGEFVVVLAFFQTFVGLEPQEGALTQMYAATSPEIEEKNISGEYFHPIAIRDVDVRSGINIHTPLDHQSTDANLARKVWEYGESVIASIPKDQ